jgi:hypothetical protein
MTEHRTKLLKLLAHLDQSIAECEQLAADPLLADADRADIHLQLVMRMDALDRVQNILNEPKGDRDG